MKWFCKTCIIIYPNLLYTQTSNILIRMSRREIEINYSVVTILCRLFMKIFFNWEQLIKDGTTKPTLKGL